MVNCKHCGIDDHVKNGYVNGKQRYKCKGCGKTFREGDKRVKYSHETKMRVLKWYLEGAGIMSIERQENVPNPLIIYWIRQFANILREKLSQAELPEDIRDIQILELDELYSFCQKKSEKSMYGLLWTGSETRWWILK